MRRTWLFTSILLLLGAAGAVGLFSYRQREAAPRYLTARVERGRIASTVNATGTVNAVVSVQVGSQVTGRIQALSVDFNSPVSEGQIIAQIDPAPFQARVQQARANLANAQAAVQVVQASIDGARAAVETAQANSASARANIAKARAALSDAARTLERRQGLVRKSLTAQSELDVAQTAYEEATSQLALSEAQHAASLGQVKSARAQERVAAAQHQAALAQVEQAEAMLQVATLDLEHTTIRSPVQGTVIDRSVDVGQTVAASLQAPTLLLIAQDLTRMQVNTNVSEADIGQVHEEQRATFTVDAYPEETFVGKVTQVRNAPITLQNVVTYDAVIEVANSALKLKPGMTANVTFVITERDEVLKIPNAALRFQPSSPGQYAGAVEGAGAAGADRQQAMQQRLTQALSLSREQQERLEGILQASGQQGRRLREQDLTDEERRARRRELHTQTRAQISTMLTEEQRQQYAALLQTTDRQRQTATPEGRPGRVWSMQVDGQLELVPLRLGIADDTFTEVVSGSLSEGQEIVTGLLLPARRADSTPPGFGRRPF